MINRNIYKFSAAVFGLGVSAICLAACNNLPATSKEPKSKPKTAIIDTAKPKSIDTVPVIVRLPVDTAKYNRLLRYLAHDQPNARWPVKGTPYPLPGAILPFKRVVAFYGNFYSKRMGILGELPPQQMLQKLKEECKKWAKADSLTPVIPALHYIVVSAQHEPGKGNRYNLRMPFKQIDKALALAKQVNGIVFLDIQVGQSTLEQEIPKLEPYLKLDNVHLAIDPEFSMKGGHLPGSRIGTFDAQEINYASGYLAKLVRKYNLTPKIFIVHRFTMKMVTNYKNIKTRPEVQFVMDMDGWGFQAKKIDTYDMCERNNPVQFTGFKLFYKNDIKTPGYSKFIMTPQEVLKLFPKPVYIQYQ